MTGVLSIPTYQQPPSLLPPPPSLCSDFRVQPPQTSLFHKVASVALKVWNGIKNVSSYAVGITLIGSIIVTDLTSFSLPFPSYVLRSALIGLAIGADFVSRPSQLRKSYALNNTLIGLPVGAVFTGFSLAIESLIKSVGLSDIWRDSKRERAYFEFVSKFSTKDIVIYAGCEESVYRGFEQIAFKAGIEQLLPKKEITVFPFCQIPVASLVAIVCQSILFGMSHRNTGVGLAQLIDATAFGLITGVLKEKEGLFSCIVAHAASNFIELKVRQGY
jgi:membrane protease YdiL (CAAX protease family)